MASTLNANFLVTRQINYNYNCNYYGNCSTWNVWGRWAALGALIFFFLVFGLLFSCINSRRRRRRGMQPMYGTGWMAKPPYGNNNYYPNQPYNGGPAAPPYSPQVENQYTGNTFNSNEGYYNANHGYGGQQSGIELQQPQSAYQPQRGGDVVYDSPVGPPPGKGDHIIR